jgi:predicted MFS family arabinose efflux permease
MTTTSAPRRDAHRDLVLLWSGNAASAIGCYGARIAYPLLVMATTGSATLAGWIGFAATAPSLLLQIPAGVVADYLNRKTIMMWCQAIALTASLTTACVVAAGCPHLGLVVAAGAFMESSATVFFDIGEIAAVADLVAVPDRSRAIALLEVEQPIAIIAGRAMGALGYAAAHWLPFLVDAATSACCLGTLSLTRARFAATATRRGHAQALRDLRDGITAIAREPLLRMTTAVTAVSNALLQLVMLRVILQNHAAGRPAWLAGVVLAMAGVGGIAGAVAAPRMIQRMPPRVLYVRGCWVWAMLLSVMAADANPIVSAACWGCVGAVGTVINVAVTSHQVRVLPEQSLGRSVGAITMLTQGAMALGALAAGYLSATLGITPTGWLSAAVMVILAATATVARPNPAPS